MPRKKQVVADAVEAAKSYATYIGLKECKVDNVAASGLIWSQGETHEVTYQQALKLSRHPDVWDVQIGAPDTNTTAIEQVEIAEEFAPLSDVNTMSKQGLDMFLGREFGVDSTDMSKDEALARAKSEVNKQLLA